MTKQVRNELIVGLVFFGAMAFLGIYTIVISGLFKGPTKVYRASFPRIYGLKKGDVVRVEGLEKGEVIDLRLAPESQSSSDARIHARLRVAQDVEIYRDTSEVKVTPFSPLGGRIIEIKRGHPTPAGKYTTEDEVPNGESDMIHGTAEGELLQTLNELVDRNAPQISRIVSNLAFVSDRLRSTDNVIGALLNDAGTASFLNDMAKDLAETSANLNRIVARIERGEGVVGELVSPHTSLHDNVNAAAESARGALKQAETLLANANQGRSALGVLVSDDPAVSSDARAIVHDVSLVTHDVAEGKGSLGKLVKDDRLYEGAATTAENLGRITDSVAKGESAVGVLLNDPETGRAIKSTIGHLEAISGSVEKADGALGMVVKDAAFRDRVARIFTEVERLTVEFRDSVEDLREQAPINAFLGAVFAAF